MHPNLTAGDEAPNGARNLRIATPTSEGLEEVQLKPTQPTPTQQPQEPQEPAATIPQMPTCGEKAIRHIKDRQSQIFEISHPFITTFFVTLKLL